MIFGNLNALPQAGLPAVLHDILALPQCSLAALQTRDDGRFQLPGAEWFCTVGPANTQRREDRHTEYHHQWADIQVLLTGEEIICAGTQNTPLATDEERKPDLFITTTAELPVSMLLQAGDFAVFLPGEPHQALCAAAEPMTVRKAVFKVPRSLLGV
ncbi:YhcH/YjgK/YiaL family protein [Citrobacter sp. BDA59-3]|uniref:YhcH/YjgK/YiaL family protein n=1 Tax=Citrobacter sp. BDA59-3 TaxID=2781952 RepID=UPI00187FDDF6|nr:YhcH/YjgK/YiaL family protein [Citrobacter sp. BDA59-3]QOV66678.1 YhcH/YjgK/YiaL family protein [Citrobacter sp. BDA59-3]